MSRRRRHNRNRPAGWRDPSPAASRAAKATPTLSRNGAGSSEDLRRGLEFGRTPEESSPERDLELFARELRDLVGPAQVEVPIAKHRDGKKSELHVAALEYAAAGWPVFPLLPRGKTAAVPSSEGGQGILDATTDSAVIDRWWTNCPDANIGFVPGRAGIVVIDQDGPLAQQLAAALGLLDDPGPSVITGRPEGGRHYYFAHPGGSIADVNIVAKTRFLGFLEVRADEGYVVLPPSVHPSGKVYTWQNRSVPLRQLPLEAVAALQRAPEPADEERLLAQVTSVCDQLRLLQRLRKG